MKNQFLAIICLFLIFSSCKETPAPEPFGAIPTEHQLKWHDMNYYAFVHFNMNTFTGNEWGFGETPASTFNPTELDCRQWASVCKEAGMKGIILTAKHHDGFCLWPSAYTEYSVKNSPWKNGQGDVVRELSEACKEYGLKFGVYLSPWDRNHAEYGTPAYLEYYRNQMRELLSNYGDVFEFWLDGANGGDGYYGGANERRNVDRTTYYDWDNTLKIVEELQAHTIIFSDGGPGCRWVGNEEGFAYPTNWNTLNKAEFAPGVANIDDLHYGQEDGTHWIPAEVDVSIRPGWYYHPYEDHKVKSLPHLLDIYYNSVGRGANLLLNFPVDQRGLIHEKDVEQVLALANQLKLDFASDLAKGKKASATAVRGNKFKANNTIDGNQQTYWSTPDSVKTASIEIDLGVETEMNRILIQEYIALGQRVRNFTVEILQDNQWKEIASETTIGYKRILRLPTVKTNKIRLNITDSKACPLISNIEIYLAPKVLTEPKISRNQQGIVTIVSAEKEAAICYTTDGTEPDTNSTVYSQAFEFAQKGTIKAIVVDQTENKMSPVASETFDIPTSKWTLVKTENDENTRYMFDGNDQTDWTLKVEKLPASITIDLGETLTLTGFCYTPNQARYIRGIATSYQFFVSTDGKKWGQAIAEGEFANIQNSPVKQTIQFAETTGRYIRLIAKSTVENQNAFSAAEFSVITN